MALSPQELQMAKDLKARGVSNTLIMGHIAQARQGRPSIVSDMMESEAQSEKKSTLSRVVSDAPSDIKEGAVGLGKDIRARSENILEAGEARLRGEQGFARTAFQQVGQIAGGLGDIVGNVVGTGAKLFTTQQAEENISGGMAKIAQDTGLVDAYQKLQAYKEQNPASGRDIEATLGILELALDRVGLGVATKGAKTVKEGAGNVVDGVTQATKGAVDAISDIQMPNIPNVAPGLTQATRDFASRAPRAINNLQEGLQDKAMRAERIRNSPPMVAKAIEVNVPDNTISLVTETDAPTRKSMLKMLDDAESGARDARPSRVVGDVFAKQYDIIDRKRAEVGKKLEEAINNLPDATVDMRLAYRQLDATLAENGIRVGKDGTLDFTKSQLPTQQRTAIERLYKLTTEAGDVMDARTVHAKDRMFSAQKRADMKTDMLDDVLIKVNGETKSIYDTFRDIYRNQLDNLDGGSIRALNKDYAILRNTIDEADNSIFKTSRTKGIEIDPSASAMVNLRRIEGEALSTPYFQKVADTLDTTSRVLGYNGAKPRDLITFAEDLRTIYPDTVPKAGFTGSIRTAVKPSVLDLADKAFGAGRLQAKDQQKALRKLLSEYDDYLRTNSPATQNAYRNQSNGNTNANPTMPSSINMADDNFIPTTVPQPARQATDLSTGVRQGESLPKSTVRKVLDAILPGDTPNKQGGFVINPFTKKKIKAIDEATKRDIEDVIKYIKSDTYNKNMQTTMEAIVDKYGVPTESLDRKKVLQYLNKLLEKTKTIDALPGTRKQ